MLGWHVTTPEQLKLEFLLQQALGTDSGRFLAVRAVKGQPQVTMAWIPICQFPCLRSEQAEPSILFEML